MFLLACEPEGKHVISCLFRKIEYHCFCISRLNSSNYLLPCLCASRQSLTSLSRCIASAKWKSLLAISMETTNTCWRDNVAIVGVSAVRIWITMPGLIRSGSIPGSHICLSQMSKWQSHTLLKHIEIHWHDAGCQAALEGTCQKKKTLRAWTKIQETALAHGKKIGPVDTQ